MELILIAALTFLVGVLVGVLFGVWNYRRRQEALRYRFERFYRDRS